MISNEKLEKGVNDKIYFNTYRPNITKDVDFEFWGKVHTYIKECKYPIIVSKAFYFIDKQLEHRTDYGGGGMKYLFWFESEEHRAKFRNFMFELTDSIEDYEVPAWFRTSKDGIPQSEKRGKRGSVEPSIEDAPSHRYIKTMYKGKSIWATIMVTDDCNCVFTEEDGKRVYIQKCKNCKKKEERSPEPY